MIRAHITRHTPAGWTYRLTDTNTRWTLTAGTCDTHAAALTCACDHIHAAHLGLDTEPINSINPSLD